MTKRKMKDSGVAWIGQVPEGWSVRAFRFEFSFSKGLNITKADLVDEGLPVVSYGQIHAKYNSARHLFDKLLRFVPAAVAERDLDARLNKGDFVFADTSEDVEGAGNFVLNDRDDVVYAGYHDLIARPNDSRNSAYLAYLFQTDAWRSQLRSMVQGIKVFSITQRLFKKISLILPPLAEQRKIAAFLDGECGKIDRLRGKVEKQIAALEEYRKSVITEAVTKGIKRGRKMKPSGVEWIGEVPEDWQMSRLKNHAVITTGNLDTQDANPDGDYPFYVRSPIVERADTYTFEGPGILMAGDGAGAGRIFHLATGKYAVHQRVYRLFRFKDVDAKFLWRYLSVIFPKIMDMGSAQSTVPSVRMPMLSNLRMFVPHLPEQREIAAYVDRKCAAIDSMVAKCREELDRLAEYKKSLIYEYVTGKKEVA